MTRITKNKKSIQEKYDSEKVYSLEEASKIVKEISLQSLMPLLILMLD